MRCILFGHTPMRHPVFQSGTSGITLTGAEEITICADCGKTLSAPRGMSEQPRGFEAARRDHFAEAK